MLLDFCLLNKISRIYCSGFSVHFFLVKMKPLETIQRLAIWLCVHPPDGSATVQQKSGYAVFASAVLIFELSFFMASMAFCWKFKSTDMEKCLFAFTLATVVFGSMYIMIRGIVVMRPKMAAIFTDLSIIYKNSKCRNFPLKREKNSTFFSTYT